MRRLGADCFVVVRHRLCRPTANETLVSHCRVVGIELRRRVCFFVALKRGNARGAKGAGHRHLARVNRQREEMFNGRRQPSRGGTSRMMREYQVRFGIAWMLLHTAKNERHRPQDAPSRRRLPRPPVAGAKWELLKHSSRRPQHPPPDYQTGMYIEAHRAPFRPVEKSNSEDSVNFFVAHRE